MRWTRILTSCAFAAASASTMQASAYDPDYAVKNKECDQMLAPVADVLSALESTSQLPYFDEPIPLTIHHIWFGSPVHFEDERATRWQELAKQFSYAYHLWTEQDDPYLRKIMGDDLFEYMAQIRREGRYDAASDICRYVLLEHLGGIYTDVDIAAPEVEGKLVDLREIIALEGLIVATERQVREVANGGFFAQNHIIMSSAHHPVLKQMVDSLLPNRDAFAQAGGDWSRGAQFWTGQILWNMTLNGPFSVLSLTYLRQYNIFWERRPDYPFYLYERHRLRCLGLSGCAIKSVHTADYS